MDAIVTSVVTSITALTPNLMTVGASIIGLTVVFLGIRKVIQLVRRG